MKPTAAQCVKTANSEVGYTCGTNKRNKYAAYIDKNFPTFYNGKKNGVDFCDIFVDFCVLYNAKSAKDAEFVLCQPAKSCGAGVKWSWKYYKAKNRTTKTPHVGDQIFLTKNKKESGLYHTGIVAKVNSKYVWFDAANEGATKNGKKVRETKRHKYLRSNVKIYGYGRPRYAV